MDRHVGLVPQEVNSPSSWLPCSVVTVCCCCCWRLQVGQDVLLPVPTRKGEPERKVRVLVRAEGPTRVLTVLDINRHSLVEELQLQPEAGAALGGAAAQAGSSGSSSTASGRWPYQQWRLGAGSSGSGGGERGGSVAAVEGRATAASAGAGGPLRSGRLVPSGGAAEHFWGAAAG